MEKGLSRTPEHAQAPRSSHILFYLWKFGLDQQARPGEELVPYKLGDHGAQNIVGDAGVPDAQVKPCSYHPKLTPALALVRAGNVHSQGDSCSPSDSWGPRGRSSLGSQNTFNAVDAHFCFVIIGVRRAAKAMDGMIVALSSCVLISVVKQRG